MKFEIKVKLLCEKKHKGRETEVFLHDVVKMAEGEALEYLLGEVTFCDAKVDLSLRPMIPRPETEYWVKQAIEEMWQVVGNRHQLAEEVQVLDLFSGSGCVGLAVLRHLPQAKVTFVEIDKKSEEQIARSLARNKVREGRVEIVIQDVVEFLKYDTSFQKFDIIFAVPPYVPQSMHKEVMEELHAEEPLFFFDKEEGYYYHSQVLAHARSILYEGGGLYLEFDVTQREKIEKLLEEYGYTEYSFFKDPYGNECAVKVCI